MLLATIVQADLLLTFLIGLQPPAADLEASCSTYHDRKAGSAGAQAR
jgi:hypothetical protein